MLPFPPDNPGKAQLRQQLEPPRKIQTEHIPLQRNYPQGSDNYQRGCNWIFPLLA